MICSVPGCAGRASRRYGSLCEAHRIRNRRHGDPRQVGVTVAELKAYRRIVRKRIEKNAGADLWRILETRWRTILETAEQYLAAAAGGKVYQRDIRKAYHELAKLAANVEVRDIIETVATIYVMQDQQPQRFRSDRAFTVQLVRRVRGLSAVNAGEWFNASTGKVQRAYRDLPPRAALALGQTLAETFGAVGLRVAQLERLSRAARDSEKQAFRDALMKVA